jgi:hypothetical protein
MAGGRVPWSRRFGTAVLVLVALALAVATVRSVTTGHLGDAANIAQLLSLAVDLGVLVVSLVRRHPVPATSAELAEATDLLAEQVATQWRAELGWRGLFDPEPIRTVWFPTGSDRQAAGSTTNVAAIADLFLVPGRRLVLVGEPGMGKTTLAALLLLELVERRPVGGPVPLLLSISDWNPATLRFDAWLARRLAEDYPALRARQLGTDTPRQLVNRRLVLPVLDGVDEAPEAVRRLILAGLNRYLAKSDLLVLTCRKDLYEAVGETLHGALVYEAAPVARDDVVGFLAGCITTNHEEQWRSLLVAPAGTALEHVLSPFVLWLIRTVYLDGKRDPTPLIRQFPSAAELQNHLLGFLVESTLVSEPPGVVDRPSAPLYRWDPAKATRYLQFLARGSAARRQRAISWWTMDGMAGRIPLRLSQFLTVVVLFTALFTVLDWTLPSWLLPRDGDTWDIALRRGAAQAGVVAVVLVALCEVDDHRRFLATHARGFARRLSTGLAVFVLINGAVGATVFAAGWALGFGGSLTGVVYGPAAAAILGFRASGPGHGSRRGRNVQRVIRVAVFALLYTLAVLVVTWYLAVDDEFAYTGWLAAGLLVAIVTNNQHEPRYVTLRLRGQGAQILRMAAAGTVHATVPAGLALLSVVLSPPILLLILTGELSDPIGHQLLPLELASAAPVVVGVWLVLSITTASVRWASLPWPSLDRLRFRRSLRNDRWSTLVRVVSTAVALLMSMLLARWALLSAIHTMSGTFDSNPLTFFAAGILIDLDDGFLLPSAAMLLLVAWLGAASSIFDLSNLCLAMRGRLPFRIVAFLDDCRRSGLLREVGPRYEFRHATFQDYLVAAGTTPLREREGNSTEVVPEQPGPTQPRSTDRR